MTITEDYPLALDAEGRALWRDATNAIRVSPHGHLAQLALGILAQLRLVAQVTELRAGFEVQTATILMAADRLGGLVEGKPTHSGNFLQRIDELVETEKGAAAMREALTLVLRDVGHGGPNSDWVSMYTVERIRAALGIEAERKD
jgi:hypothetical protein